MLVQVDGWSGSGKSVLMHLLDGHPEVYSHPFHDVLPFLFRKTDWNEEWLKAKDIRELRIRLAKNTQYYQVESFVRQGLYIQEFKTGVHLKLDLDYSFSEIDEYIISALVKTKSWIPTKLIETFYDGYYDSFFGSENRPEINLMMGGWKGLDNFAAFPQLFPGSKRIVVKRDIKNIIAVKTRRTPVQIDYQSKKYNNISVSDMIETNEVRDYFEFYNKCEGFANEFPSEMMIIDFEDLINKKKKTLERVCDFLNIEYNENIEHSTFIGQKLEYNGMDYSEQVLDSYEKLLSQDEVSLIEMEISKVIEGKKQLVSIRKRLAKLIKNLLE